MTNYKKTYLIKDVREWIEQSDNNETSITTSNKKRRTSIVEIQGLNVNEDKINNNFSPNSTLTIALQQKIRITTFITVNIILEVSRSSTTISPIVH